MCAIRKKALRPYLFLNMYMAASLFVSISRYNILQNYGLTSPQYTYFYYYSDALLTICLYFALTSLFSRVFGEMQAEQYVKLGAVVLLERHSVVFLCCAQPVATKAFNSLCR